MSRKPSEDKKIVATNRRARHDYFIDEVMEAGIVLRGTEVKSLRNQDANLTDCYVSCEKGEVFLINAYIPEYSKAHLINHSPRRVRKLLLNSRQIRKLIGALKVKGVSMVPLSIYFNNKNLAKVEVALVRGKKEYDKREALKQADWKRQKARLLST